MSEIRPRPSLARVMGHQFRSVGLALRRDALIGCFLVGLATLLFAWGYLENVRSRSGDFTFAVHPAAIGLLFVLGGLLIPASVWRQDEPERRAYFWSLPVGREVHQLTRVFAGWAWWMIGGLALFAWFLALALLIESPLSKSIAPGHAAEFRDLPLWHWAVPFAAATATYLLGTVAALLSNHPGRWVWSLFGVVFLVFMLSEAGDVIVAEVIFEQLFGGRFGFDRMAGIFDRESIGYWLPAITLWLGGGAAAAVVAAFHYQES